MSDYSIAVIRCACGQIGVSFEDEEGCGTRVTSHEGCGPWDLEQKITLTKDEWSNLAEEARRIVSGEA